MKLRTLWKNLLGLVLMPALVLVGCVAVEHAKPSKLPKVRIAADGNGVHIYHEVAGTASSDVRPVLTEQPVATSKYWRFRDEDLPSLEQARKWRSNAPVYGLYTGTYEYRAHRDSIKQVGWKSFRMTSQITDADMKMFVEDGADILRPMCPMRRNKFQSDDECLTEFLNRIDHELTNYGPGGTFFQRHPDLPVRPIRLLLSLRSAARM